MNLKPSELLSDESKWCRGEFALDRGNAIVSTSSERAVKWCIIGAIDRCIPYGSFEAKQRLRDYLHTKELTTFNDSKSTTYAEVIAALRAVGL